MTIPETILALSGSPELSVLFKATVLLALALAVVRLAGRSSASVRHLVLASMFAALIALPLVITSAPGIRIDFAVKSSTPAQTIGTTQVPSDLSPAAAAPAGTRTRPLPSWKEILRVVWIGGAILQFGFLAWQLLRLRRVRRAGVPWLEGREQVRRLAGECGVRKSVDVLLHENIVAPVTCGGVRPVILLPFDAQAWSEDNIRRAIIHELEHVRRGDWATQRAARAAVACYWFHPLAWVAWRQFCLEAERAADDAVLRTAQSAAYAEQLVALARSMNRVEAHAMLGMANRSDLSARVSAMLDGEQRRGRAGFPTVAGTIAVAALLLVTIGPLTAVAQQSKQPSGEATSRRVTALDRTLYEAAEAGDLREIEELLKSGANVNAVILGDGTPLLGAARKGQLAAVNLLLGRGADPNIPAQGDGTPLIAAAAAGHANIVDLLLERGADMNLGVPGDGNPLIMAAGEGRSEMVSLLLDRGARIEDVVPGDENALCKASEQGQLNVVRLLVSRGANVNIRLWAENGRGQAGEWRSPLIMARRGRHQAVVDFLIASGARD